MIISQQMTKFLLIRELIILSIKKLPLNQKCENNLKRELMKYLENTLNKKFSCRKIEIMRYMKIQSNL